MILRMFVLVTLMGSMVWPPASASSSDFPPNSLPMGPRRPLIPYSLDMVREGRSARHPVPLQFSQAGGEAGKRILTHVTDFGLNETEYLINVKEPRLFQEGIRLSRGHPGLYLAAFNQQKKKTKNLAKFGYASLRASDLLSRQFLLTRQQALFGLEQVSLRNTELYKACPVKSEEDSSLSCPAYSVMYRTLDGTCNNLKKSEWGAAYRPFARFLPPDYSDGIEIFRESVRGGPLPNPRLISSTVHRSLNRPSAKVTMFVMQWGQFLDHDITATAQSRGFNHSVPKCCNEQNGEPLPEVFRHPDCMPISIPPNDIFYSKWNHTCMEFLRSSPAPRPGCALGPRDQINQVTSYIDASNVYGSDDEEMADLRLWEQGMLKYTPVRFRKPLLPPLTHFFEGECRENSRNLHCFQAGDVRVNEQPGLTSMHTIWLREHNRLVTQFALINPHWNDDRLFFEARKVVGAFMQKITYGEWLPTVLGPKIMKIFRLPLQRYGYYRGYEPRVNPTATNVFGAAAFRFGHSLVQHTLDRCDKLGRRIPISLRLHHELMNPANVHNFGSVDRLMLGLAFQMSQSRDVYMTDELTRHLFQTPAHNYGMDLAALNLQRGRDHGLPGYNVWREQCGLTRLANWGQLLEVMDDDTVGRLAAVYSHVDDIDIFTGGLAEKPVLRGLVGPTFACILGQQFRNLRSGDRFWFENGGFISSFRPEQLRELRKISLARILCDNLDDIDQIQPNVFRPVSENGRNKLTDCKAIPALDLNAWAEHVDDSLAGLHYTDLLALNLSSAETPISDRPDDINNIEDPDQEEFDLPSDSEYDEYDHHLPPSAYSTELPRPFVDFDEAKAGAEDKNHGSQQQQRQEEEEEGQQQRYPSSFGAFGGRPLSKESPPSLVHLTDHNFNHVMAHAYSNTLFYRRKRVERNEDVQP